MADVLTPEQRGRNMAAIKGKNTKPEMLVRRLAHGLGYRYRLHSKTLPGKPDLVFPKRKKIIEVYGCYWHMHECRYGSVVPKTNTEFWQAKRLSTVERDKRNIQQLERQGWKVLVIWECQTKDEAELIKRITSFLEEH
jgi:DNA mismatch endonuclease (patch repair protein)